VYAVNYPLQYFAQRIGGDAVSVHFPAPPDEDPAYWQPDGEAVAAFQGAGLVLLNGAGYAKWVDRATLPQARVVNTSAAVADRYIELEGDVVHAHGPEGEHEHSGHAFTTWLDLTIAVEQARAVAAALSEKLPEERGRFERELAALEVDLLDLDARLEEATAPHTDSPLVMSHPVYQYMTRRYGLTARSVHWEPDQEPTQAMWDDLRALLREHPANLMVWEGTPSDDVLAGLREVGLEVTVFAPCGAPPEAGDFLSVMRRNVDDLAEALGGV
jgi:zinc transport system substrate-binding protein